MFLPLPDFWAVFVRFYQSTLTVDGAPVWWYYDYIYPFPALFVVLALRSWHRSGHSARTVTKMCSVFLTLYNRPIWLFNGHLYSSRRSIALPFLQALWAKLECQLLTTRKSTSPVRRWSAAFFRIGHTSCETNDISGGSWIFVIFRHRKVLKNGQKMERLKNKFFFCISILFILHILIHSIFRGTMKKHESI